MASGKDSRFIAAAAGVNQNEKNEQLRIVFCHKELACLRIRLLPLALLVVLLLSLPLSVGRKFLVELQLATHSHSHRNSHRRGIKAGNSIG